MTNFDTGRVRVRLACNHGRVSAVQVSSERPNVAMVLRGRNADQAVRSVPLLFSLCGQAQARAASLALAAARGEECLPKIDPDVRREVLREYLWRCLLDLPPLLGLAAMQREFVSAAKWVAEGDCDELKALLTGSHVAKLRQLSTMHIDPSGPAPCILPLLDAQESLIEWPRLNSEFCRLPNWRGMAAQTGAVARYRQIDGNLTLWSACWLARLDELLDWATADQQIRAGGAVSAASVAPGIGRSLVETARGLLMHEIVLDGDRVADYLIVAPTEWNFHPQGALADHLIGQNVTDRDALQQHVAHIVSALDPCVPWELEWA
jgi:hypothetical protein